MFNNNPQSRNTRIFLGQTEWMLVQAALEPKTVPAFAQRVNPALSPDELRGALVSARESLMAREWLREDDKGQVEINPILEMCWRSVTSPRNSLALTLMEPGRPARQVYYNRLTNLFIGNWMQPNRAYVFDMVEDGVDVAASLIEQWFGKSIKPDSKASSAVRYQVPPGLMPESVSEQTLAGFVDALQKSGVKANHAKEIESLYGKPSRRASLVFAADAKQGTQDIQVQAIVWLSASDHTWLVTESKPSPEVTLHRVSEEQLAAHIAQFVRMAEG